MPKYLLALVLAVVIAFPVVPGRADPPPVIATKAAAAPSVDGNLDEAMWRDGPWYTDFTLLGEGRKLAEAQTRFKVAFDDSHLYFAVQCFEPNMDKLVARHTQRDSRIFLDDCVEIMVDPTGDCTEYYHFIVNVIGTLYDAQNRQGGNVRTVEWDCNFRAATARGEESWTVEVAIPFVELGLTSRSRGDWALNVARERYARKELSSFTEGRGGFHQPTLYTAFQLPGADLDRYMWTVRAPFEVSVHMEEDQLVYSAKTHITNDTGRFWFVQLHPELIVGKQSSSGKPANQGLDSKQGREVPFSISVREQGPQVLRLRLVDRRDPARVLYVKSVPLLVTYTSLAIDITRPCYRDCIYATQKLDNIELTATSALREKELSGRWLTAEVYMQNEEDEADARPVAQAKPVTAAKQVKLAIPAADLKVGDYQLVVKLVEADGEALHTARKRLRKLPPAPNGHEWRVNENNVLLHNGESFLPFGWFSQGIGELDPADGYTAMQSYAREWFPTETVRGWLDEVAAKNTYVAFPPYSPEFMNRGEVLKQPMNDEERALLRQRVSELMDHPAVLGWYMFDEPELKPVLPQRAQELYEVIRDTDPYHPCIMLNDTIKGIYTYARGGDILMPDPYPLFLKGDLAATPIEKTSKFMEAVRDATGGRKPAWITPQGFNYGDYGRAGNRCPNFVELRNQLYQAVVHGAKGFLWYTYGQIHNYPDLKLGMPFLAREVRDLKAAILADDEPEAVTVKAPKPGHIHAAVRRAGGEFFLLAVNTATEPQEVTFVVKGAPKSLYVVSEGRKVSPQDGRFTDQFDLYTTHLYTTDAALAERESLAAAQAKIDQAEAARKKPGNLAFEDSGVRVVVSGNGSGSTPNRVVDGITAHMRWTAREPGPGDWLQLIWPEQVQLGRVVICTTSIDECEIQIPGETEDEWVTVGKVTPGPQPLVATFEPLKTQTLRIIVTKLREGQDHSAIQEVEAYAK